MRFFCHFWLKGAVAQHLAFGLLLREFFLFFWPDVIVLQRLMGKEERNEAQTGNKNNSSITNII
jgi:thiosulfate reductase cytochrome b subunit